MRRSFLPSLNLSAGGKSRGFSLVEVVLALAIVSFALVGILSIFPVALDTAQDSKIETRVTLIAQSIFSDLQTSPVVSSLVLGEVVTEEVVSPTAPSRSTPKALSAFTTVYVAYNQNGRAIRSIPKTDFDKYTLGDAAFLASVSATTTQVPLPGLALINVSIQAPPAAPGTTGNSRKKYYFSAYVQTQ